MNKPDESWKWVMLAYFIIAITITPVLFEGVCKGPEEKFGVCLREWMTSIATYGLIIITTVAAIPAWRHWNHTLERHEITRKSTCAREIFIFGLARISLQSTIDALKHIRDNSSITEELLDKIDENSEGLKEFSERISDNNLLDETLADRELLKILVISILPNIKVAKKYPSNRKSILNTSISLIDITIKTWNRISDTHRSIVTELPAGVRIRDLV